MRKLILFLVFSSIVFSQGVYAQKEGIVHPRFRALLNSGERIEGKNGYFTSTTFNGISNNGQEISVGRSDIKVLDVSSGSKTMQYAAIGSGIGFVTCLMAVIVANEPEQVDAIPFPLVVVVTTLVGGIVGANQTEWTRVPIRTTLNLDIEEKNVIFTVSIPFN